MVDSGFHKEAGLKILVHPTSTIPRTYLMLCLGATIDCATTFRSVRSRWDSTLWPLAGWKKLVPLSLLWRGPLLQQRTCNSKICSFPHGDSFHLGAAHPQSWALDNIINMTHIKYYIWLPWTSARYYFCSVSVDERSWGVEMSTPVCAIQIQ